jgi:hypothetical protein
VNNNDERDYLEEDYNRRTMVEEDISELADKPGMWAVTVVLRYQYGTPRESGSTGEWAGLSQTGGSHTLPVFYLNPNVQGILSETHAKSIVHGMVGTILQAAGAIGFQADYPVDLRLSDRLLTPEITAVWIESDGLGGPEHIG